MILFKITELGNRVEKKRAELINTAKLQGITHPGVIKVSQELDKEIIMLQKYLLMFDSKILNRAI